jgi:hypothetical protein
MSGIEILLSDSTGVYIPKFFAEHMAEGWSGGSDYDLDVLKSGPEAEAYWEVWDWYLTYASHTDKNGKTWRLYQDGDLFAVCDDLMSDEEYKNFYGEDR